MAHAATPNDSRLLSPEEAARLANVCRRTIYREAARGALPVKHVGRQIRIDRDEFREYLDGEGGRS